jgi:hypothetical protein
VALIAGFVFALAVVFASYNPEGWSYYHWLREGGGSLRSRRSSVSRC